MSEPEPSTSLARAATGDSARCRQIDVELLATEIESLRTTLLDVESEHAAMLAQVPEQERASARNLVHYLALRQRDLRDLQLRLAAAGLSSLGRAEPHVLASIEAVRNALRRLQGASTGPHSSADWLAAYEDGAARLEIHAERLLGTRPRDRGVRIMVTLPSEAAAEPGLVRSLLAHGMDCARINCAHDDAAAWRRMITHLRDAESELGRECRVLMDLGGPKLRTGPVEPGPRVVKWRPRRDAFGRVAAPARIWLQRIGSNAARPSEADAVFAVDEQWLGTLESGDRIEFVDARGARRHLEVIARDTHGAWTEARRTAYLVSGSRLVRLPCNDEQGGRAATRQVIVPPRDNALVLHAGDRLVLTRERYAGRPAILDSVGRVLSPARISLNPPEVMDDVRAGERIWFDDGRFGGICEESTIDGLRVRIEHAPPGGGKLRADRGVNLPDSQLRLPALTDKDREDLDFVAQHADMIGLSYANTPQDVETLQAGLAAAGPRRPGIVLKIETRRGFDNLPAMLLAAMRTPPVGVMIARGDLAIECGFERLAEVQEEILWLAEAAHCPVIWATQVLENLAKTGMPSRAEVSDASMGTRAECVMLNKGPYITSALTTLSDILGRMQSHLDKKRSLLRELKVAHGLGRLSRG